MWADNYFDWHMQTQPGAMFFARTVTELQLSLALNDADICMHLATINM